MKKIFVIDWLLVGAFVLSALSGVGLHVSDEVLAHETWHNWAVLHVLSSLLFLIGAVLHVETHWGWYKSLFKNGLGRKSRVTVAVSVVFLLLSLTGVALLGVDGGGSALGLWHYRIGLVGIVLFAGHVVKRIPLLRKSLARKKLRPA